MMMSSSSSRCFLSWLAICLMNLHAARATWSILAADVDRQQTGLAIATCITLPDFYASFFNLTFTHVPGKGAMVAQALLQTDDLILGTARELMRNGTDPATILATLATEEVDGDQGDDSTCCAGFPDYTIRQYGAVNFNGGFGAYTGPRLAELYDTFDLTGSEQRARGGRLVSDDDCLNAPSSTTTKYVWSAQGNIVEPGTVAAVARSFEDGKECLLADKLMAAMEAGAASGLGDIRCTRLAQTSDMKSKAALIAYIRVVNSDGSVAVYVPAIAGDDAGIAQDDAVALLRTSFDEWKSGQNLNSTDVVCNATYVEDPTTTALPSASPTTVEIGVDEPNASATTPTSSSTKVAFAAASLFTSIVALACLFFS